MATDDLHEGDLQNVARKLIRSHLVSGVMRPGEEIALRIDQTLTHDATGTLVMQELEALSLDRVRTDLSAQYVDHNLLQTDDKNAQDHEFLLSACRRYGLWFSKPGNGVSHPTHMQRFGKPGLSMVGSDSHTPAGGALGMLAIGVGGLEVALAIAGEPLYIRMPQIWGVELTGQLPQWCSAKDVILEMLRRHGVRGGLDRIIEYHGPGLAMLTAMDRHVIANMGAELGATTTVFPADRAVLEFLRSEDREDDYTELLADDGATYDVHEQIDLSIIEPLIAKPSSPDNVTPVRQVAGEPISQVVIGSSANPGLRDFAMAAAMVAGHQTHSDVSFDINPSSREIFEDLTRMGATFELIRSGARIHQSGCMGCIGMGQAPELTYPALGLPMHASVNTAMLVAPLPEQEAHEVALVKGPNISALPDFDPLPDVIEAPILLAVGDNISTDDISPAGARALPFRSNIPKLAEFTFTRIDPTYPARAAEIADTTEHFIVGGDNYGQGSSRERTEIPGLAGCHYQVVRTDPLAEPGELRR
nr:aconitase family protein [Nocardia australiensis]